MAFCTCRDGTVAMYDLSSGQLLARGSAGHGEMGTCPLITEDSSSLVSVGGDGVIIQWQLPKAIASKVAAAQAAAVVAKPAWEAPPETPTGSVKRSGATTAGTVVWCLLLQSRAVLFPDNIQTMLLCVLRCTFCFYLALVPYSNRLTTVCICSLGRPCSACCPVKHPGEGAAGHAPAVHRQVAQVGASKAATTATCQYSRSTCWCHQARGTLGNSCGSGE